MTLGGWGCFWAVIVFIGATVSLVICVTIIACGLAAMGYVSAGANLVDQCGD